MLKRKSKKFTYNVIHGQVNDCKAHLLKESLHNTTPQWWTLEGLEIETQKSSDCKDFLNSTWGPATGSGHPVFTRAAPRRRPSSLTPAALLCGLLALPFTTQAPKHGAEVAFPALTHSLARRSLFRFSTALQQGNKPVKRSALQEERAIFIFFFPSIVRSCGGWRRFNRETRERFSCNLEWLIVGRGNRYDITKGIPFFLGGVLAKLDRLWSFFLVCIVLEWV